MNCDQACISKSLVGLTTNYRKKYKLKPYYDSVKPCAFIGMYRDVDFNRFIKHRSDRILIFAGSDALNLNPDWVEPIKKRATVIYSISQYVYDTLQSYGIDSVIKRYSATIATQWKNSPMGDSIYWYYGIGAETFYGSELIEQIEQQIDIPIIKAHLGSFTKKQLHDIYSQCFINLRLTPHDGCPNSNLQMGLMGRKSIYNGDLPYSLKWDSVDDIVAHIKREYRNRNKPNHQISSEFFTFVKNN